MNAGAAAAEGDILVFLHADTRLPMDALELIDKVMAQPGLAGGAFDLGIRSNRLIYRIIATTASLRSRLTGIPYGDQAIFIRRTYFKQLGGYPDIPLMEDVAFMRQIKKAGGRIHMIPKCVSTSPRRWEKEGVLYTTLRNWILFVSYSLGVSPETLARYYRSGKDAYERQR
jgi:rSAM/selenodomain-associated transferase 2